MEKENLLFLQSDVADPYAIYQRLLAEQPVCRDARTGIWGVYSHAGCRQVLHATTAHIPELQRIGLNAPATALLNQLVRVSNPPIHPVFRQAAMRLFEQMQPAHTGALLARLSVPADTEIDWVDAVCKKLPALAVLTGFGFSQADIDELLPRVAGLTALMLPNKSAQQLADINAAAAEVYPVVERHAGAMPALRALAGDKQLAVYVANLIGLLIQSYDAGRGILSNALLQALAHPAAIGHADRRQWQRLVVESLRYDPPIHNTRRVLTQDIQVGDQVLQAGETVLVVLASANRDPAVFERPAQFDVARANNEAHMSFGAGMHACLAQHFSVALAADALMTLFGDGRRVMLAQREIAYEPMVNARLPKTIRIYSS